MRSTILVLALAMHEAHAWSTPPYNADDYKGGVAMTWSVPQAAVNIWQFRYTLTGTTITLIFQLEGTVIGGTPSNELLIRLPQGKAPAGWFSQPVCFANYVDPVTTGWVTTQVYATTGRANPFIGFVKMDQSNWAVWSGNPTVNLYCGPIVLEVQ